MESAEYFTASSSTHRSVASVGSVASMEATPELDTRATLGACANGAAGGAEGAAAGAAASGASTTTRPISSSFSAGFTGLVASALGHGAPTHSLPSSPEDFSSRECLAQCFNHRAKLIRSSLEFDEWPLSASGTEGLSTTTSHLPDSDAGLHSSLHPLSPLLSSGPKPYAFMRESGARSFHKALGWRQVAPVQKDLATRSSMMSTGFDAIPSVTKSAVSFELEGSRELSICSGALGVLPVDRIPDLDMRGTVAESSRGVSSQQRRSQLGCQLQQGAALAEMKSAIAAVMSQSGVLPVHKFLHPIKTGAEHRFDANATATTMPQFCFSPATAHAGMSKIFSSNLCNNPGVFSTFSIISETPRTPTCAVGASATFLELSTINTMNSKCISTLHNPELRCKSDTGGASSRLLSSISRKLGTASMHTFASAQGQTVYSGPIAPHASASAACMSSTLSVVTNHLEFDLHMSPGAFGASSADETPALGASIARQRPCGPCRSAPPCVLLPAPKLHPLASTAPLDLTAAGLEAQHAQHERTMVNLDVGGEQPPGPGAAPDDVRARACAGVPVTTYTVPEVCEFSGQSAVPRVRGPLSLVPKRITSHRPLARPLERHGSPQLLPGTSSATADHGIDQFHSSQVNSSKCKLAPKVDVLPADVTNSGSDGVVYSNPCFQGAAANASREFFRDEGFKGFEEGPQSSVQETLAEADDVSSRVPTAQQPYAAVVQPRTTNANSTAADDESSSFYHEHCMHAGASVMVLLPDHDKGYTHAQGHLHSTSQHCAPSLRSCNYRRNSTPSGVPCQEDGCRTCSEYQPETFWGALSSGYRGFIAKRQCRPRRRRLAGGRGPCNHEPPVITCNGVGDDSMISTVRDSSVATGATLSRCVAEKSDGAFAGGETMRGTRTRTGGLARFMSRVACALERRCRLPAGSCGCSDMNTTCERKSLKNSAAPQATCEGPACEGRS